MTQINTAALRFCAKAVWLAGLLLGLLLVQARPAWAEPLDVQRAYWMDASGTADIEQAQQQTFLPSPKILGQGYGTATTWLRVTVPPCVGACTMPSSNWAGSSSACGKAPASCHVAARVEKPAGLDSTGHPDTAGGQQPNSARTSTADQHQPVD